MESLKQAKRVAAKADRRLRRAHKKGLMGTEYVVSPEGIQLLKAYAFALDRIVSAENRQVLQRIAKRDGNGMTPAQIEAFMASLEA